MSTAQRFTLEPRAGSDPVGSRMSPGDAMLKPYLAAFLVNATTPIGIYLVGDIIDGWNCSGIY